MKNRIKVLGAVRNWQPLKDDDPFADDKKIFLTYMSVNCAGFDNKKAIDAILKDLKNQLTRKYKKEQLQQNIIVPLREDKDVFIGTSGKGIYLIVEPKDSIETFKFYSTRIRSEQKHWRNLKLISNKYKLFSNIKSEEIAQNNVHIFFDESGSAVVSNFANDPVFVVSAVLFKSIGEIKKTSKIFDFLRQSIFSKSPNFEFKSNNLMKGNELKETLKHLSVLEFDCVSICFVKKNINNPSFLNSKIFRKFAFQRLVDKIAPFINSANLYFDAFSGEQFKNEFLAYLSKQNAGYPANLIANTEIVDSKLYPGCQIADIVSGTVRKEYLQKKGLISLIETKFLYDIEYFPY